MNDELTLDQTAKVLAKIQLGDNREVTPEVVAEWHHTLVGFVSFIDAINAVAVHRRESTAYLQPAHIVAIGRRLREERMQGKALEAIESAMNEKYPAAPPENFAAMAAAWDDPVEFARQKRIYQDQLDEDGYIGPAVA